MSRSHIKKTNFKFHHIHLDENLVFAFAHMNWKRLGTEASVHHLGAHLPLTERMGVSEMDKNWLFTVCHEHIQITEFLH